MKDKLFVAEVKTSSPFGYKSERDFDFLFELANKNGDWISIHTSPQWGGSYDLVREARKRTHKPILAKGMHSTDDSVLRAIEAGADAVLVVGRVPCTEILPYTWIEPLYLDHLVDSGVPLIINKRDLSTGWPRTIPLIQDIKSKVIVASFIKTPNDVPNSCDGFIVGEGLEQFCKELTLLK